MILVWSGMVVYTKKIPMAKLKIKAKIHIGKDLRHKQVNTKR
jgi:hypothetical protein